MSPGRIDNHRFGRQCVDFIAGLSSFHLEEKLYTTLYDELPLPCITLDPKGFIVEANQLFNRATGFFRTEVIGTHISGLLTRKHQYSFNRYFLSLLYENTVSTGKLQLGTKYDPPRDFKCHGLGLDSVYHGMEVVCLVLEFAGNTPDNWDFFQSKMQSWTELCLLTADIVTIHDKELRVVAANQTACDHLTPGEEMIVGRCCHQLFFNESSPCSNCHLQVSHAYGCGKTSSITGSGVARSYSVTSRQLSTLMTNQTYQLHIAKPHT